MKQDKSIIILSIFVGTFFVTTLCLIVYIFYRPNISEPKQIGCTLEVKLCPDGSSVGRVGPICEFSPCPETVLPTVTPNNLKTYSNSELGFSISYPSEYGDFIDNIENGQTGRKFTGSVGNAKIVCGGISKNYSQGRSGTFSDFSGYTNNNGKIMFKAVQIYNKEWELYPDMILDIYKNSNGVEIIFVKGVDRDLTKDPDQMGGPIEGSPGQGKIGALINLNNAEFPGIAFEASSSFGLDNFKKFLSNFKLLK